MDFKYTSWTKLPHLIFVDCLCSEWRRTLIIVDGFIFICSNRLLRRRMNPTEQADDLKAFERRMIEIVASLQPSIWRWRIILLILVLITLMTFYILLTDFSFSSSSIRLSTTTTTISSDDLPAKQTFVSQIISTIFRKDIFFTMSFVLLIFAFLFGIHRKIFASSIIVSRFRYILADYNMSCDSKGHLIIKPRPTTIF